jgi:predicted nucleic acid-binding protein
VVLDAGPLGFASGQPGKPRVIQCDRWLQSLEAAGAEIIIPEIADYEVRRELICVGAPAGLRRLDSLQVRFDFAPIASSAMRRAAEFWASLRNTGVPTAGPHDLDADAILAGQAMTMGQPGDVVTVATTNLKHLSRFPGLDARLWTTVS